MSLGKKTCIIDKVYVLAMYVHLEVIKVMIITMDILFPAKLKKKISLESSN